MYQLLPSRTGFASFSVAAVLFAFLTFSNQGYAQCSLTTESLLQTNASCGQSNGSAELITSGGVAPVTYNWNTGASTAVLTGVPAGVYTVTATDGNTCQVIETIYLNNDAAAVVSAISSTDATCLNADGSLSFTLAGNAPFNLSWSGAASGTQNGLAAAANTINNLVAGDYIFNVTDAAGCQLFFAATINETGNISLTATITQNPTCAGGTDGIIQVQATSGTLPFEYFINGASQGAFNQSTFDYTNLAQGTYEILIRDGNGCSASTTVVLDEVGATVLDPADFAVTDVSCPATADGIIGTAVCTTCELYEAATGNLVGTLSTPINNLLAGDYYVQSNNAGCISTLPLTINAQPNWAVNVATSNPNCVAGNIDITVSGATPTYTYSWSNTSTSEDLTNVAAGTYGVTITDNVGCTVAQNNIVLAACSSIDTVVMDIPTNTTVTNCLDTTALPGTLISIGDLNCTATDNGAFGNPNFASACFDFVTTTNPGLDTVCTSVCDDLGFCDTTIFIFNVYPASDTVVITLPAASPALDTCPINVHLSTTISSVTDLGCDVNNVGTISVDPTTGCLNYIVPAPTQNSGTISDTVCVEICDLAGFCDTMIYIINNEEPNCGNLLPNSPIIQQFADCSSSLTACIPTIPYDSVQLGYYDLTVYLDNSFGSVFSATQETECNEVTRVQYPFSLISSCSGDYEVTWQANGVIYGPDTVSGLAGIINFMNFNDGNTAWALNAGDIATGTNQNGNTNYNNITVTCIATGTVTNVGATAQPQYAQGTELSFPASGEYPVVVEDTYLGCMDTATVYIYCASTEQFLDTLYVGDTLVFCLDTTEVSNVDTIYNYCASATTGAVEFIVDQNTGCVTYIGDTLGSDIACFLVCDAGGACDTTFMYIDVALPAPVAVDDSLIFNFGQDIGTIDVCANDQVDSNNLGSYTIVVVTQPTQGVLTTNGCSITYESNTGNCGSDVFEYMIFNAWGVDTATVFVDIPCDTVKIYEGFSPNGDGVNDVLTVEEVSTIPNNEVTVYNRWGNLVFKAEGYDNSTFVWDGTFNGRDLPDDYYLVVLIDKDSSRIWRRWVRLQR